jgi:hypothetical protein
MIISDNRHPNSTSDEFMADSWYTVIGSLLPGRQWAFQYVIPLPDPALYFVEMISINTIITRVPNVGDGIGELFLPGSRDLS